LLDLRGGTGYNGVYPYDSRPSGRRKELDPISRKCAMKYSYNRPLRALLKGFLSGISRRRLSTYAAAGTYYIFLALPPMLILLCSLIPYTPLTQEDAMGVIRAYMPESVLLILENIIEDIYAASSATLTLSILLTTWSASASMRALMRGIDAACGSDRRIPAWLLYLRSFLYMIGLVLTLLISLCVMVYGGRLLDLAEHALPSFAAFELLFRVARYFRFAAVFFLLIAVFTVMYRWVPNTRFRYSEAWPGALFGAVTWVLFSLAFTMYMNLSDRFGAYGIIGSVMVAMMWMYFCLLFLLVGAWLNRFLLHPLDD